MTAIVGIVDGNTRTIDQTPGPLNMRSTLSGFMRKIRIGQVIKSTVNFRTVETVVPMEFSGVIQPLGLRDLMLKAEGERAWDWRYIHTTADLPLKPDDVIEYQGTRFRVMSDSRTEDYGFKEYHVVNDYGRRPNL